MRLRRLDLLRYGHFTDRSFDFPADGSDLCIVFGPNEAGKSTALVAIGDLLFGIPTQSPYKFLHDYTSMRIGAVLEDRGSSLEVRRRKGRKDTLLGTDDLPVEGGEGALAQFLVGADRAFFERMFSLDHVRLEEGGRELLNANDEVGQMLFSAGAGIADLRDRFEALSEEADALWGARRASHRLYTRAEDKLKEADKALREQTFTANRWQELKRAYEDAEGTYAKIEADFEEVSAKGRRLSRIRRVYRYVRRKAELDEEIRSLGSVVLLPENSGEVLDQAERKESEASTRIDTLSGQLAQASSELEGLTYDEALLLRADDVHELHEQRIKTRGEKADLPKRQAELKVAEDELEALATELGWPKAEVSDLIGRIPARPAVSVVRSLLGQRGGLASAVESRTDALEEAEATLAEEQEVLGGLGEAPDVSRLSVVTKTVREMGDITGRVRNAEQRVGVTKELIQKRLASMHPNVPSETDVTEMLAPPRAGIQSHRDKVQDWERRLRETRGQIEAAEGKLDSTRGAFERTVRDEHAITVDELKEARHHRDTLWSLLKLKHIEASDIPDEERVTYSKQLQDLPGAFEPAMRNADDLADRRFDNAEAAGKLAEMSRTIEVQEEQLGRLQAQELALHEENMKLDADWQSMWASAPFEPLAPDAMMQWLEDRGVLLDATERLAEATGDFERLRKEENEAKEMLLNELAALGAGHDTSETDPLQVVLHRALDIRSEYEAKAHRKSQQEESIRDAATTVERRRRELRRASDAWSTWQEQWTPALGEFGLATTLSPDAVEGRMVVIDQMRDKAGRISELRYERIDKIMRDVVEFDRVVAEIAQEIAPDLLGKAAEDVVLELESRLKEAQSVRDLQAGKKKAVEDLQKQVAEMKESRREARESTRYLNEAAATDTTGALKKAIEKSDVLRTWQAELAETLQTLQTEGDGLSVDELAQECASIDVDQISAQEETNAAELDAVREQFGDASEARAQARGAFQAVGGDDAAALAAAKRQEALAEMREVAARYVRVRTSAMLLQWAIDRYRREKQAPLLKRAGELFATITGGSFSDLRVDYDEQDQAHLAGLRPGGEIVRVSGMSTGTADQLYLALRVASVEDYLDRAEKLPFVADDLFINFDDDRAAAGFEVLGRLAQKTQVLFFTHHQHLVDIARDTLGASVRVVSLVE